MNKGDGFERRMYHPVAVEEPLDLSELRLPEPNTSTRAMRIVIIGLFSFLLLMVLFVALKALGA